MMETTKDQVIEHLLTGIEGIITSLTVLSEQAKLALETQEPTSVEPTPLF